jgi:hypothetical protein
VKELVSLVEKLIAEEPFEADGFKWAARPQSFYCEALGISGATLRRIVAKPPFTRRVKLVKGIQTSLLMIGDPPKDATYYRIKLAGIWKNSPWHDLPPGKHKETETKPKASRAVSMHEGACLWGFADELTKFMSDNFEAPEGQLGGELAVAVFKHALADWQQIMSAIKLAMEARPGYKPKFYDYPSIPIIRNFWKASVYAYVEAVQMKDVKPPPGLEDLALPGSWAILALTGPLDGHPGVTAEMAKTYAKLEAAE